MKKKLITIVALFIALIGTGIYFASRSGIFHDSLKHAYVAETKLKMETLRGALWDHYNACGTFPTTLEGLSALAKPVTCNDTAMSAVQESNLKDAWGEPFIYDSDGNDFTILSYGSDKAEGGIGDETDIGISSQEPRK